MGNRKKSIKQRGQRSHGYGSHKKHRGAGHRGGRGAAGSGKKGDAKKPSIWKNTKYAGKQGFKSKNKKNINPINIAEIETKLQTFLKQGKIKREGTKIIINLKDLARNKLLSKGKTVNKYEITTPYASAGAIEKITKAGGEIKGLLPKKEKIKKQGE
jgi:large subunit ribosomal protein L15